jgi:hypothetical protein
MRASDLLKQGQATLEASVPSTTMSAATSNRETKLHARALRRSLEALDDIQRIRADIVRRTNLLADADNIQPRIAREATGVARWAEVTPAMFEDTIQEELVKFDKFRADLELGVEKQTTLLADIKVRLHAPLFGGLATTAHMSPRRAILLSCSPGKKILQSRSVSMRSNLLIWPTTSIKRLSSITRKASR